MNKAYKVVYSESTGTYVAVAEIAIAKGKSSHSVCNNTESVNKRPVKVRVLSFTKLSLGLVGIFTSLAMPLAHAAYTQGGGTGTGSTIAIGSSTAGSGPTAGSGISNIAIGNNADTSTSGGYSIAIGRNALVGGGAKDTNGIAVGSNSAAYAYGVAIGTNAVSDQGNYSASEGTVAIGAYAHVNNADSGIAMVHMLKQVLTHTIQPL